MCLFPRPVPYDSPAWRSGVREFGCGCCPECLSRRSRYWALRACMEAKVSPAYMITLTYDNYIRDKRGEIIGEFPPDRTRHVSKRDCQLFFKRLRRAFPDSKIKYICTAEYGSHTHRAHYHVLLFGIVLTDLIFKGRSKRGNIIHRSPMLSRIWANAPKDADWRTLPIVTVDATLVGPAVARYCTKYCSKDSGRDGGDDTFMLFSRGIGDSELVRLFNGRSYVIDGREYPIPKTIWQRQISENYGVSFRYVRPSDDHIVRLSYRGHYRDRDLRGRFVKSRLDFANRVSRRYAREVRDADPTYQSYIKYWQEKNAIFELTRPSAFDRIRLLPDNKYHFYKVACLRYLVGKGDIVPPRSSKTVVEHAHLKRYEKYFGHLPSACHYTADDTDRIRLGFRIENYDLEIGLDCPFNLKKSSV